MNKPWRETQRQIDYITVSQKYRNAIRKAQIIPGWQASMMQQHGVVQLDICRKLLKNYKKTTRRNRETIQIWHTRIKTRPAKNITMGKTKRRTPRMQPTRNINPPVEKLKQYLHQGITQNYPLKNDATNKLQEWAQKAHRWSPPAEWETFQNQME